ncbi:hypothetical protein HHI36_010524, partial [Cryptolaemus montrouzieri]
MRTLFILLNSFLFANAYNILAVFPHEGKSHQMIFGPIIRELARKGHTLTVLVHYSFKENSDGYREILLKDPNSAGQDVFSLDYFDLPVTFYQLLSAYNLVWEGLSSCECLLSNENVRTLIQSDEKFDLIIAEFFNSECSQLFVDKFKAPLVGVSSTTLMPWHTDRLATPDNPSYIPNNHFWNTNRMDFSERIVNTLGVFYYKMIYCFYLNSNKYLLEKYSGHEMPDLEMMMKNTSLLLVNSHFSLSFSRPMVPGVQEIGGVHITQPKTLPK